ncbi:MAG: PqqD family protein [Paracoccus sp. (in: a-proteobacteria)]|nr:PqqD family protein [Paracoccus sp. (in: a-proteobacteria)]
MHYEQNLEFRLRRVGTRSFLIRSNSAIELSGVGEEIWKRLEQSTTVDDITAALAAEYDAEPEVIRYDVSDFIDTLEAEGAVIALQ